MYVGRSRVEGAKGRKSHLGGSASRVGDVGPRETPLFESALRRPAGKFTVPFISPELVGNGDTPPLYLVLQLQQPRRHRATPQKTRHRAKDVLLRIVEGKDGITAR